MNDYRPWGMELNAFLMLMHLSQLAGIIIPGAGLILPIVMWATNKAESKEVDRHGKVILNWMISLLIYVAVSFILMLIFIGTIALVVLGLLNIVFIVIGAIRANEGKLWHYPLCIRFFAVD